MNGMIDENTSLISWSGEDKKIIVYPVDFDRQLNAVCTHPQELSDTKNEEDGDEESGGKFTHPITIH